MRPKLLEIEGLQSFRDTQVIDFDTLSETGLFGIFGPTGSGKSTVLDAITFALYGRVKRAEGGIQGIINSNENLARVSFTFELEKDGTRRRYRAERVYRRKKGSQYASEAKIARLVEITESGEIPLCDKTTEVTAEIRELLGLNHEDFTRAVVLPQNSFQEFLLLNNSERRGMLERIFYLEEYGKQLWDKLSRKMSKLGSALDKLSGELKGYEDASDEALLKAYKAMSEAAAEKNKAVDEFQIKEADFHTAKEIWSLVQDLALVLEKEQAHASSREIMNKKRLILEKAEKADTLPQLIKSCGELAEKLRKTESELNAIIEQLPGVKRKRDDFKSGYEKLKDEIAAEQPRLLGLKARLTDALAVKAEIAALTEKLDILDKSEIKIRRDISVGNSLLGKEIGELDALNKELDGLNVRLENLRIPYEYRRQIQDGTDLENSVKNSLKNTRELENKTSNLRNDINGLEQKLEAMLQETSDIEKKLDSLLDERKKHESEMIGTRAALLLCQSLKEGEPCPVCGSRSHPRPLKAKLPDSSGGMKAVDGWEKDAEAFDTMIGRLKDELLSRKLAENALATELKVKSENLAQLHKQLNDAREINERNRNAYQVFLEKFNIRSVSSELERLSEMDRALQDLQIETQKIQGKIKEKSLTVDRIKEDLGLLNNDCIRNASEKKALVLQRDSYEIRLRELAKDASIEDEIKRIDLKLDEYEKSKRYYKDNIQRLDRELNEFENRKAILENQKWIFSDSLSREEKNLESAMKKKGFSSRSEVEESILSPESKETLKLELERYDQEVLNNRAQRAILEKKLNNRSITDEEWNRTEAAYYEIAAHKEECVSKSEVAKNNYEMVREKHVKWLALDKKYRELTHKYGLLSEIQRVLKAEHRKDNSFIDYIAEERLRYVAHKASETLGLMTGYKYALELDADTGFNIRDNASGGICRRVNSLSGGETFLTSLSLALALSEQIQLKGQSPLEFFFLDEGFGTLDRNLLDTVIDALERLSKKERVIGLISHVPELRPRIGRRLIIDPPTSRGEGSTVKIERA